MKSGLVAAAIYAVLASLLVALHVANGMAGNPWIDVPLAVVDFPIRAALGSHAIQGWFSPLHAWLDPLSYEWGMFFGLASMRWVLGGVTYFVLGAAAGALVAQARVARE